MSLSILHISYLSMKSFIIFSVTLVVLHIGVLRALILKDELIIFTARGAV